MNILIVGLGSIAQKHIEALKILKLNAKIYALRSNPNSEIQEGINNIYNLENLNVSFDFAIISNPTNLHYEFIEKLAHKEIPLFIEKPAVHKLQNVTELIDLIEDKQIVTYVACNLRFHPCIEFLKKKIESQNKKINELNVYCGSYLPGWRPGKDFRTIYSANAEMGGGVHLDLFHEFDYIIWLFGHPNKSNSVLRNVSSLNINAVDYANFNLQYNSFTASVVLNYYRRKPKRAIELLLDNQTLTIDLINNCITDDNGNIVFEAPNFTVKETYVSQLKYFIDCLEGNNKPMNSLKESIEILKIVLKDE